VSSYEGEDLRELAQDAPVLHGVLTQLTEGVDGMHWQVPWHAQQHPPDDELTDGGCCGRPCGV
jgi:hypothetical protein